MVSNATIRVSWVLLRDCSWKKCRFFHLLLVLGSGSFVLVFNGGSDFFFLGSSFFFLLVLRIFVVKSRGGFVPEALWFFVCIVVFQMGGLMIVFDCTTGGRFGTKKVQYLTLKCRAPEFVWAEPCLRSVCAVCTSLYWTVCLNSGGSMSP